MTEQHVFAALRFTVPPTVPIGLTYCRQRSQESHVEIGGLQIEQAVSLSANQVGWQR